MGRHSTDIVGTYKLLNGDGFTVGNFASSAYRKSLKEHLRMGTIDQSEYDNGIAFVAQLVHMTHCLVINLEDMDIKSGIDT